jgi:hypothetical protein
MHKKYYFYFGAFLLLCFAWCLYINQGEFIYPLDDAYIHMALARNLADDGVLSINKSGFESASSSILYTLILSACFKLFGHHVFYNLIINGLAGFGIVYQFGRYMKRYAPEVPMWFALTILAFSTNWVLIILQGMEHPLHLFFCLCLWLELAKWQALAWVKSHNTTKIALYLALACATRFETIFIAGLLFVLLSYFKLYQKAFAIALLGLSPIIVFGLISIYNGGFFLPNSVLLKGELLSGKGILASLHTLVIKKFLLSISFYKWLLMPFGLIVYGFYQHSKPSSVRFFIQKNGMALVILSMSMAHLLLAILEFRYENYILLSLCLLWLPTAWQLFQQSKISHKLAACLPIVIMAYHFLVGTNALRQSSKNIGDQQLEMAKFFHQHYKGQVVAANDIGAIAYFSEVELLDLVGLGNTEVSTFLIQNKKLSEPASHATLQAFLRDFAHKKKAKVAIIYKEWFEGVIPENWIPVAHWTNNPGIGPAVNRVYFYALTPEEAPILRQKLWHHQRKKDVKQVILLP